MNITRHQHILYVGLLIPSTLACDNSGATHSSEAPPLQAPPPSMQPTSAGQLASAGSGSIPRPGAAGAATTSVGAAGAGAAGSGSSSVGQGVRDEADTGPSEAGAGAVMQGSPLSEATRAWWSYERAPEFEVAKSEIMVPLRDGVALACHLSRPARGAEPAPGKFPGLIVEYTPYALIVDIMISEAGFFAQRGYNALVCHVRGSGLSGGNWNNAGARQDGIDAYDLIEWLAAQPFSDGRMGQFGGSYGGFTSYQAAAEQPPHLLATAPMIPPGSLYHDVIYPGGIKTTERGIIDAWPVTAELLSLGRINADAEYATNRAHPTFDAYWQERSMYGRVDAIQVPILTIGAWNDGNFRAGTLADIEAGISKTWAIYGQWEHRSPVALEAPCDSCVTEPLPSGVLLAWFDHWVKQLPNVPLPLEPLFISEEGPRGVGQGWRELSWNSAINPTPSYHLGADNTLSSDATATGSISFREPLDPTEAGGSVVFTTTPLDRDHVLAGHPTLHLRATLSASDANFYVELIDVQPNGEESLVNDGFLKASHRSSNTTPEPAIPGSPLDYVIAIRADHYRFAAGNRLRIRISGGDSMSLVPPEESVEVTLETGNSSTLHMPRDW